MSRITDFIGRLWIRLKSFVSRHPILSVVGAIVTLIVILLLWLLFKPAKPQYLTEMVRRGDLVQKVEAVGTVASDQALNLKFPVTGIVESITAKEGDKVSAGQELAHLRNSSYVADVASAAAQYRSALASLQELEEGTRPEDIAIAEAEVANKRAALDAAKADLLSVEEKLRTSQEKLNAIRRQADTSLAGSISAAGSTAAQQLALAKTALRSLEDILIDSNVDFLASQYVTTAYSYFKLTRSDAISELDRASQALGGGFSSFTTGIAVLQQAHVAIAQTAAALQQFYDLLSQLPLTAAYDSTTRETYKGTIATQKANANTALTAIDAALNTLRNASTGYDASITTEETTFAAAKAAKQTAESTVLSTEMALRTQEATLALKKAGPRETSIDVARANANAAAASVSRALARLQDTIIRAPVDGVVTKMDFKLGEFTGDPDNMSHSVTMLGASPYRVEMYLSEVDIPKVNLTQSGAIELDAFPGVHFALRVISIEPGPTKIDAVSKYRVTLAFVYPHDNLKIGMTGDGEIVTGERNDVLLVPVRAVIQDSEGKKIVRVLDGDTMTEKPVVTDMESDTDAEIVSGLSEGETVVVLIKK